jgi:glycosyltransferase involved in cell wall biosynthesis
MIESGVEPRKVVLVRNFIDASKYRPDYSGGDYIVYFGRLSEEKGLTTLLKAMELRRDIRLIIIGTGPEEVRLQKAAVDAKLNNVEFLGFRSGDELHTLIKASRFTITPSEWYENCPMSILEANALGKPVVGARVGGIPELIREGVDGVTFDMGDSVVLAEAIGRLWDNPKVTSEMGYAAREKIEKEFNADQHYEAMMKVYDSAIANRKMNIK